MAGTITTRVYGSNKIFIIEKKLDIRNERAILSQERTEYAKRIRDGYEKGYCHAKRSELKQLVPRNDGISNTLTSVQKDNLLLEKRILSYSRDSKGKVVSRHINDIAGTVHTKEGSCGNTAQYVVMGTGCKTASGQYVNASAGFMRPPLEGMARTLKADCNNGVIDGCSVRKLTPRECFRLMDVSETDIDRIQVSGVSRSQQYKMAGNSIVVACLYHIFRKMFIDVNEEGYLF